MVAWNCRQTGQAKSPYSSTSTGALGLPCGTPPPGPPATAGVRTGWPLEVERWDRTTMPIVAAATSGPTTPQITGLGR